MTDASHITLLPELLAHVRAVAPQVRLETARIDGNTAHALESGEADLALGYIPWIESGIYQQTLFPLFATSRSLHDRGQTIFSKHPRIDVRGSFSAFSGIGTPDVPAAIF
jgi:DNA-binding transcriptional LysR family regulator